MENKEYTTRLKDIIELYLNDHVEIVYVWNDGKHGHGRVVLDTRKEEDCKNATAILNKYANYFVTHVYCTIGDARQVIYITHNWHLESGRRVYE